MAEWMWSAMEVIDVIPLAGVILVPLICKIKYGRFFRGFLWGIPIVAVLFYLFYRFMGPGDEIIFFGPVMWLLVVVYLIALLVQWRLFAREAKNHR